jgi:EAL domain-containing protein (putative c-di-GMP-specific phosphodiesterase class I)
LSDRRIVGAEALIRWFDTDGLYVRPDEFLPLAEETGMILEIGEQVLDLACAAVTAWRREGLDFGVAVNLSPVQLRDPVLPETVIAALAQHDLAPEALHLDMIETIDWPKDEAVAHRLRQIDSHGVALALDDYGTGNSSLAHLIRQPIRYVKIDRSLIADLPDKAEVVGLIHGVVAASHAMKYSVIAEGVETAAQQDWLKSAGVDLAQGYLYARPLPYPDFVALAKAWPAS